MAEIDPHSLLASPISEFVRQIAIGVADAQTALDRASLALWKELESEATPKDLAALKEIGYQPTWYTIPVAEAEIKLTFYYEQEQQSSGSTRTGLRRMLVLPHNAKTQNTSKLREEGASQLKLKIVPTPPPASTTPQGKPVPNPGG